MKTQSKTNKIQELPSEYKKLMAYYCIRPIRDEIEYDHAVEFAGQLAGLVDMTPDQEDYFDLLTDQIEKYDQVHYPIEENSDPLDLLKFLLEENGMNGSDLGNLLGNRQLGSKILRGERQLSKKHIRILADRFKVSTDLFL